MACKVMHCWTFSGLVGAFLDLVIAYFLLCASFVVFFSSKFVSVFGLSLPCPCDGIFVNPYSNYCLHRLLVEFPVEKVSNVQLAVRNKFPFDSVRDRNLDLSLKLVEERNVYGNGFNELEGEASCSSLSDSKRSENVVGRELVPVNGNGGEFGVGSWPGRKVDMKGKGIMNHRQKLGIRRRRRSGFDHRKFSSVSYYDRVGVPQSPSSINEERSEMTKGRSAPVDFGFEDKCFLDAEEAPTVMIPGNRNFRDVAMNEYIDEYKPMKKNDELRPDAQDNADGDLMNNIRGLEQALEEEHIARADLYLELEKERNAAATAADEALAMILRLQEEKASIEMQARQYQRIIEEKSAYDAEEMNILKEILLRREMEKHFLEKEVEAYRQMGIPGNEQLDGNLPDMMEDQNREPTSFDLTEDTDLMLHELCESIEKKDMVKPRKFVVTSNVIQKCSFVPLTVRECDEDEDSSQQVGQGNHLSSNCTDDDSQELQEKEMLIVDNSQLAQPNKGQKLETYFQSSMTSSSLQHNFLEKTIPIIGDEQETTNSANICQSAIENGKTQDASRIYIQNDDKEDRHGEDVALDSKVTSNMMFDKELHVYDVHVIDDKSKFHNEVIENESELVLETDTSKANSNGEMPHESCRIHKIENKRNSSSTSSSQTVTDIGRSDSDMAMGQPPFGSRGRSLLSEMRRSSMSTLDTERIKIDTEIEWLREKLRTVQEGRDKLNLTVDQEKETLQLQLLEDIASQLREIRQLTEPGKALCQASLPPLSSKAISKKRRCQSAYLNNSS